jgi:hypothetical protein
MLVITAPAMIAIMTILARDATAGAGGLTGMVDWSLTALPFGFRSVGCLRRHAAIQDSGFRIQERTLRACIYKENPSRSRIILPLFDRLHESS